MAKSYWRPTALALAGILLLGALAGCAAAGTAAITGPAAKPAAKATSGFLEKAKAEDLNVTLAIEPLKVGDNRFVVALDQTDVTSVEAQVIMASMGHGQVLEMEQVGPGKFEIDSGAIDMEGRWMIRIQAVTAAGAEKTATFHLVVK